MLHSFTNQKILLDSVSVNHSVSEFTHILTKTADLAGIKSKSKNSKAQSNKQKPKTYKWYNGDCTKARLILRSLSKEVRNNPHNLEILQTFRKQRKLYKKILRASKQAYQKQVLHNLDNLKSTNPRAFWDTFNELKNLDIKHKANPIPAQEWVTHFTKLFNQPQSICPSK